MPDEYLSLVQFKEYVKRMEADHDRIGSRIELLENQNTQITTIAVSVEKLALSMKQMAEEQKAQRAKLESFEARDGEMWRKVIGYIVTTIMGIIIGFLFKQFGI